MIARGQRRKVPPAFAPANPPGCQTGPVLATAPEPAPRQRARGPPGNRIAARWKYVAGAPTIPSPDMLLGQRSDPASPAVNQAPD